MSDASAQNAAVICRAFEAWNRGDIDAYLADLSDDVEAVPVGAALEGRVCLGHADVRAWWESQSEVWESFRLSAEEFEDVDAEDVDAEGLVVSGRWRAVARSGVEVSAPATWVFRLRAGKIVYWHAYTARGPALEAVGLSE